MADPKVHCWAGKREHVEATYGIGSPEFAAAYEPGGDGTCMMEDGHEGSHDFTPDNEIGVRFAEES